MQPVTTPEPDTLQHLTMTNTQQNTVNSVTMKRSQSEGTATNITDQP